jgi:hypothetical protein
LGKHSEGIFGDNSLQHRGASPGEEGLELNSLKGTREFFYSFVLYIILIFLWHYKNCTNCDFYVCAWKNEHN